MSAGVLGCGGGGSSGPSATGLAFTVNWEHNPAAAAGDVSTEAFDTPIPPSVNAIRFLYDPAAGSPCCIAVKRGSQAFTDRHIVLANVLAGPGKLEVDGFAADHVPTVGTAIECLTNPPGQGESCQDTSDEPLPVLPSWSSDEVALNLVEGTTNVVNVDVHSVPFLLALDPANREHLTLTSNLTPVDFTVVDAEFDVDPDINVTISQGDASASPTIAQRTPCRDNDSELPDCSAGGVLDVRGFRVSTAPAEVSDGTNDLTIRATNTAPDPATMVSNSTFDVNVLGTTTTTTSSTTITNSTTTTNSVTTTTLTGLETFCLDFSVTNQVDLVGISYTVGYGSSGGTFIGSAANVDCVSLLSTNPESTLATFNDDDGSDTLNTAIISAETFSAPTPLAECRFQQVPPLDLGDFHVQVTEATAPDLTSVSATVGVEEVPCGQ